MISFSTIKEFFEPGAFPLTMAFLFGFIGVVWEPLGLPTAEAFTLLAEEYFDTYGIITLFVAAFIESMFMISFYFPGSFVVVLAILVSDRSLFALSVIVLVGWTSVLLATVVNYWLGKEGFYRLLLKLGSRKMIDKMQAWLDERGNVTIFLSAAHPNFLAIASICMGIAREGLTKTLGLAFIGIAFWVPLTVFVMGFALPDPQENTLLLYWIVVFAFIAWGAFLIAKEQFRLRRERTLVSVDSESSE